MYYIVTSNPNSKIEEMQFIREISSSDGFATFGAFAKAKSWNTAFYAEECISLGRKNDRGWADEAKVIFIHPLNVNHVSNLCPGTGRKVSSTGGCRCESCRKVSCPVCGRYAIIDYDGVITKHER